MKVKIYKNDIYGYVNYNEVSQELEIVHPDENVVNIVRNYLTRRKIFKVGCHTSITVVPTQELQYFDLAMNELYTNTGIHVSWGS